MKPLVAPNGLEFNFSPCFGPSRIEPSLWATLWPRGKQVAARFARTARQGGYGFMKLPEALLRKEEIKPIEAAARKARRTFDTLVVIGIGGSALGTRMMLNALGHRFHNELEPSARKGMRLYMLENDDPASFRAVLSRLNPETTLVNVVSKSGETVETASQFVWMRDWFIRRLPSTWKAHFLFTTDPEKGILRTLANREGIATLVVPPDVGGRYSVFTAVGLFPALCLGFDARALLKGADAMNERCLALPAAQNPALVAALIHFAAEREMRKNLVVAFPYADGLRDWTEWFGQLWAESLGKAVTTDGEPIACGTTPIKTLGAIDQHSQVQLYMEGPDDKLFLFLRVADFGDPVKLPGKNRLPPELDYLAGHSLGELIQAEQRATEFALSQGGRLTYRVTLPALDAFRLGQLVQWAEITTVLAGHLLRVNPFDQPGVETGKKYAYGLMGRTGFESWRERIEGKA